jgi:hypothetical protein
MRLALLGPAVASIVAFAVGDALTRYLRRRFQ